MSAMTRTKQLALCALMTALALALSYVERFLPLQLLIPLPRVKLGLANIVTLVALYLLKKRHAFAILLLRCFLGAVFGGGISGLAMSLTGGILALSVMALCQKGTFFSIYGVSILGAACHNVGQILAAMVLMNSVYVAGYLPYLLLVALLTGTLTGGACAGVLKILKNASISPM